MAHHFSEQSQALAKESWQLDALQRQSDGPHLVNGQVLN